MGEQPPVSPCINVCALDASGYCSGCYRTIGEIADWRSLSASEQWGVLKQLPERIATLDRAAPPGGFDILEIDHECN
jgi:uncharacterized protein